ncbi:uncharacterized protein C14orf119-like [Styela clava]|uniref:uncharacterized protein C14orf119-like n=1 Tax=Styela clava TaxID=7725 RepID=UPI001939C5F3|nr:uncharacterized protein C14orf119-like [Styela clava]
MDAVHPGVGYSSLREINCTIHWFQGWSKNQRECFMEDLIAKALPGRIDLLLGDLNGLTMKDKPPSLYECQLRLFNQWFQDWDESERTFMLERLESADPFFVSTFRQKVMIAKNVTS